MCVKNTAHKPDHFLGEQEHINMYKREILLTNSESHRFAMFYIKDLINKDFFNIKDSLCQKNKIK